MNKAMRGRSIDTIFVLIVFSIFALSVLMTLMFGATIYRNINDLSHSNEPEQIALSYIWTKTKNFDKADTIGIGDFNGKPSLFIYESFGDTDFRTAIYHYDGWLFELFSEVGLELSPSSGTRIVMVDDLTFEVYNNNYFRANSGDKSLLLYARSGLFFYEGVGLP